MSCCIAGGGPTGAILGLLLARGGVRVTLLEMHHDFDREFRMTLFPAAKAGLFSILTAGRKGLLHPLFLRIQLMPQCLFFAQQYQGINRQRALRGDPRCE